MFSRRELLIIWFALIREQQDLEEGTTKWHTYQSMIARIEKAIKGGTNLRLK